MGLFDALVEAFTDDDETVDAVARRMAIRQQAENETHGFHDGDIHPVKMACGASLMRKVPKDGEPITCHQCLRNIRARRNSRWRMELALRRE